MNERLKKLGLSKNVWILGVISLLNDVSSEIVFPLVPIFLTSVLGAPASVLGLIEGVSDASSSISTALFGFMSDKIQRRKPFAIFGYGLSTLSKLIMSLAYSWPVVFLGQFTLRLARGVRTTARDALILESTDKPLRGRAFGFHRSMDAAGGVFGPLLAIVLLGALSYNYRAVFFWAFIPSAIAALLLIFVKEKPKTKERKLGMHFEWNKANRAFKLFLLVDLIFTIGNSSLAFLILRSKELGLTVSLTVLVYVLFNITYTIFSVPAGVLADQIGSKRVIFSGYMLFALVYFLFGMAGSSDWVWFLFPAYGIFLALTDGVGRAYVSRLVPHEIAASAFGIYSITTGLVTFLASFIAGILWSVISPSAPFYFGGAMAFIAAVLFYILSRWIRSHPEAIALPVRPLHLK